MLCNIIRITRMIFAAVNKGVYVILDNDTVVANIIAENDRKMHINGYNFYSTKYVIYWNNGNENETFKSLPAIYKKHQFDNYPGYGHVLKKRHY